jgi:DNA-binding NarL/FixJ family response regulator
MRSSKILREARSTIYAQEIPLSIKHSAWVLFQHELNKLNPATAKPFTIKRALSNTLEWMEHQKERRQTALKTLTPMQKKIVRMLVEEGLTQKQISLNLHKGSTTIKHHLRQIRMKVGVASMYQVVAVAVELGWVSAPPVRE